jgi:hypothetical protein
VYNIRTRTKREAKAKLALHDAADYGPIKKVSFEYAGGFDLMLECLSEDGGYWEAS